MLRIRKGKKKDLPSILDLIKELAEYENSLDQVSITLEELEKDGFDSHPAYFFLLAEQNDQIIGMSFCWIRYSTWKGKVLFLEDFIIKKEYRNKGIGGKLFQATIKLSDELNLNGMCWQVLDWNKPAISFYKKYNSEISNDWLNAKLTKNQISKFTF